MQPSSAALMPTTSRQTTQSPHIQKNPSLKTPPQQKILPSILQISLTKDTVYTSNINYPPNHHTNLSLPQPTHRTDCRRDGCMVGTRCVGVSRWSYLAPEASDGKVLCGHKPQSKPHLSEPGTHQRTWRVMGRPARQKTQTLSMTRRNDRTRHDHAAAPPAVRPSLPPSIPTHKKKEPQKGPKTRSAPVVAYRGDYYEKNCMCNDTDTHHYSVFRNVLSNYPYTTRQI